MMNSLQENIRSTGCRTIVVMIFAMTIAQFPLSGQQLKINTGSFLVITGSANIRLTNAGLINNGTYSKGTETVTFSGSTASNISGVSNTILNNLLIINSGGITTQLGLLTVNDFTVEAGSKFTIDPAKAVTVTGTSLNSAGTVGLVLRSDITGTASLIHNTAGIPATEQLYISGAAEAWHFLSAPVSDQSISGTWLPSGTYGTANTGYDLYLWNEPNSCWIYKNDLTSAINWGTVHPGAVFTAGRGYLYALQALNPVKEFAGNLNNGILNYSITNSAADLTMKGFNLVGNPYPSSVDWQASAGWSRASLVNTGGGYDMWIWNSTAGNYGICNSFTGVTTNSVTRYIAPMQGFFIKAEITGSVQMDNSVRVHTGAGNWLKKGGGSDYQHVSLKVSSDSDSTFDEVQLLFGFKNDEPGTMKLFSRVLSAPSLYLPYQGTNNSVRYLTDTIDNPSVPVMFKPGREGNYTITCDFDSYNFETVLLEDKFTHGVQDMKASGTYAFMSSSGDNENRFILHFGPIRSITENRELQAEVYTNGEQLIVDISGVTKETDLFVYNTMGRLLLEKKLQAETKHSVSLNCPSSMLVVLLKNQNGYFNKKIVWIAK